MLRLWVTATSLNLKYRSISTMYYQQRLVENFERYLDLTEKSE